MDDSLEVLSLQHLEDRQSRFLVRRDHRENPSLVHHGCKPHPRANLPLQDKGFEGLRNLLIRHPSPLGGDEGSAGSDRVLHQHREVALPPLFQSGLYPPPDIPRTLHIARALQDRRLEYNKAFAIPAAFLNFIT